MAKFKQNYQVTREIDKKAVQAAQKTVYALRTEVQNARVVPFNVGDLQNTSYVKRHSATEWRLVYAMLYAKRLYFGVDFNFQTANNPNARAEWLEPWIRGEHKDFARKTYAKLLKGAIK